MKQKAFKIKSNTLFTYKQEKSKDNRLDTDTTITYTTLTNTTGIFCNGKK